jgi:hypothetical protein
MLFTTMLLLIGCPESPPDSPGALPASGEAPASGASGEAAPGSAASGGGAGFSGGAVTASGMPPTGATFTVADGEGVTISGTVKYSGEAEGAVRVDFLTLSGDGPPGLAHTLTAEDNAFSAQAPAGFGEVHLVAFVDVQGDGPSPTDPAGTVKLTVGDDDLTGLELEILDEPDLGPLTPMLPGIPPGGEGSGVEPPPEKGPDEAPADGEAVPPPPDGEAPAPDPATREGAAAQGAGAAAQEEGAAPGDAPE